jgi:hypothetical protein
VCNLLHFLQAWLALRLEGTAPEGNAVWRRSAVACPEGQVRHTHRLPVFALMWKGERRSCVIVCWCSSVRWCTQSTGDFRAAGARVRACVACGRVYLWEPQELPGYDRPTGHVQGFWDHVWPVHRVKYAVQDRPVRVALGPRAHFSTA